MEVFALRKGMPQESARQAVLQPVREQNAYGELSMGEKLERLEDEIFCLGEAMEYLGRVRECEDLIAIIEDRVKVLSVERERVHGIVERLEQREEDAMRREYERSVR